MMSSFSKDSKVFCEARTWEMAIAAMVRTYGKRTRGVETM
eukprot:UN17217